MEDIQQYRQLFPALENKQYFNFGGQGPLPRPALDAIIAAYAQVQQDGPFSLKVNRWAQKVMQTTKEAIASELNVSPETLTLTENVTAGCNIALWGVDWQAQDEILLGDCEHPGVIGIVQELCSRFGVQMRICPVFATLNEGDPLQAIADQMTPNTRMVVISHLLWNTGQILPLQDICELCHRQQVYVMVDAAQSVGMIPLNLSTLGVDFYAFTGHKWLCGPAGVGALYISPEAMTHLNPTYIGWRSIAKFDATVPNVIFKDNASRYEVATSAYPLYAGLTEAIRLHQHWGTSQQRYQQLCKMSAYCWQKLNDIPAVTCLKASPPASGLVSFTVASALSHADLVATLEAQGFLLRTLIQPDCIRACTHYFTLTDEIDRLAIALSRLLA